VGPADLPGRPVTDPAAVFDHGGMIAPGASAIGPIP
jgi:hypothetical protein